MKIVFAALTVMALASPAVAQTAVPTGPSGLGPDYPAATGGIVGGRNNTGSDLDVTVPRGATGAETFQSDSAAGGNAGQPSRAVPQGSGGGSEGGGG